MPAGAARIRPQRPLREHDRIERFQNLDRRYRCGGDRVVAVIEAIALWIAAETAAEEAEHHPLAAVRSPTRKRERIDGGERAPLRALRHGLGEGTKNNVDHPQDGFGIAPDRARRRYREQGRLGNHELDRSEAARVGRNIGEEMLERDIAASNGGRARDVEGAFARRRRAREVETHAVRRNGKVERDSERRIAHAVIVEEVVAAVGAIRQRSNIGAHQRLRARAQRGERRADGVVPILI